MYYWLWNRRAAKGIASATAAIAISAHANIHAAAEFWCFYGEPFARSSYRTIGAVRRGDNQLPSKHERKRSTLLYIFFPVYDKSDFRRLLAPVICREDLFFVGFTPQFAFLSFHEAFTRHTSSTSFLPFHLSLIERRDHFSSDILTHTFVALRAPNEAPGPATQCSECGGVMREF